MSPFSPVSKRLLDPVRVRRIRDGFSWIDRRFVREGFIDRLARDEILLYLFLVSVADARGLSYYSDRRVSDTLQILGPELARAREGLARRELIAYEAPLYQVLDLPDLATRPGRTGEARLGELLRGVVGHERSGAA